jgi:hypothetical protein
LDSEDEEEDDDVDDEFDLDSEDEGMFQTFFQWYIICFWTKS